MTNAPANSSPAIVPAPPSLRVSRRGVALPPMPLHRDGVSVGSLGDNDLMLAGQNIARRHLIIEWNGQIVTVTDLGSSTGTRLAGLPLLPYEPAVWTPGDILEAGDYTLELDPGDAPPPRPFALSIAPDPLALQRDAPATLQVFVQNHDAAAHTVTVQLEGSLASGASPSVAQLYLDPGERELLPIEVRIPAGRDIPPGEHQVTIRVEPEEASLEGAIAHSRWVVPAFSALALSIAPEQTRASEQAVYSLQVRNNGNVPADYALSLTQPADLTCALASPLVRVQPGETVSVPLTAHTPQRLFAAPQAYGFSVSANGGLSDAPASVGGTFTRVSLLPRWLPLLLLPLLLALFFVPRFLPTSAATSAAGGGPAPNAEGAAAAGATVVVVGTASADQSALPTRAPQDERPPTDRTAGALGTQVAEQNTAIAAVTDTVAAQATLDAEQAAEAAVAQTADARVATAAAAEAAAETETAQPDAEADDEQDSEDADDASEPEDSASPTPLTALTRIELNIATIVENNAPNSIIGMFTAKGINLSAVQFSLVSGEADNSAFAIIGNQLQAAERFDFETKSTYSIRVRASSGGADSFDETLTIRIEDENEPATQIRLEPSAIPENASANTQVGRLSVVDPDGGSGATFELVDATGLPFEVQGNQLLTTRPLNYEPKPSYDLTVRVKDGAASSATYEQKVTVIVTDVNEPPTDIILDNASIKEGSTTNIGTLVAKDEDVGLNNNNRFDFVNSAGNDNDFFIVNTNTGELSPKPGVIFDYESKNAYTIRVMAFGEDDKDKSEAVQKNFTINVIDENEAPTDILLTNSSVEETAEGQSAPSSLIGRLSAIDPDRDRDFVFSKIGEGWESNFDIVNNELRALRSFNYETEKSFKLTIKATDRQLADSNGKSIQEDFTINVTNANDQPTGITLSNDKLSEGSPVGTLIGILNPVDQDSGQSHTFVLEDHTDDFRVRGNRLESEKVFDFEGTGQTITIQVTVEDNGTPNLKLENFPIIISITDENARPSKILLTDLTPEKGPPQLLENQPARTKIGVFDVEDEEKNQGQTYTYTRVEGDGDDDNDRFLIEQNQVDGKYYLFSNNPLDYEEKPCGEDNKCSIRVRVTDGGSPARSLEAQFKMTIENIDPAFPPLNPGECYCTTLPENSANDTPVLTVVANATGSDTTSLTYSIISGNTGGAFRIVKPLGDIETGEIRVADPGELDFENESRKVFNLVVGVKDGTEDSDGHYDDTINVQITLTDVPDAPTTYQKSMRAASITTGLKSGGISAARRATSPGTYQLKPVTSFKRFASWHYQ